TIAFLFSPSQGLVVGAVRRFSMSLQILCDDIVGYLFRAEERQHEPAVTRETLQEELFSNRWMLGIALRRLARHGAAELRGDRVALLEPGRIRASQLVRSHRLWEQYLVTETDADTTSIHDKAEKLEHFTDRQMRERLDEAMANPAIDPHGSAI